MIHIAGRTYELVHEHKTAWNPDAFKDRYSEVLERYDYVIGDWGYEKLRLKGFFRENHPKANKDTAFAFMADYINEYCNFGCAYFVLQKVPNSKKQPEPDQQGGEQNAPEAEAVMEAVTAGQSDSNETAANAGGS